MSIVEYEGVNKEKEGLQTLKSRGILSYLLLLYGLFSQISGER